MMVTYDAINHAKRITDLRGRHRDGPQNSRFRCFVSIYEIDCATDPAIFPIALRRSAQVREFVRNHYLVDHPSIELREWAERATEIIEDMLPFLSTSAARIPTHFLMVGIRFKGKDEPFFKAFLALDRGRISSTKCARQIGAFLFHYFEDHVSVEPEDLARPQVWIFDCLFAQWRLLRESKN
jgi:hypothetical protein